MNPLHTTLEPGVRHQHHWRGLSLDMRGSANSDRHHPSGLRTGFSALNTALVRGGWPPGTCIEVLSDSCGMGAMGLFLPAMASLSAQGRWQTFIAPPFTPYAPLLAARGIDTAQALLIHPRHREELLWGTEQALRSANSSAVFSWLGATDYHLEELHRLQRAAADSDTLAVLFRANRAAQSHSPAHLRLQMREYRQVHILRQVGGQEGCDIALAPEEDCPHQPQLWEVPAWDHEGSARP